MIILFILGTCVVLGVISGVIQIKVERAFATNMRNRLQSSNVCQANAEILCKLKQGDLLKERFGIRCPKCGLLLKIASKDDKISETEYCASCDENIEITFDCIDLM